MLRAHNIFFSEVHAVAAAGVAPPAAALGQHIASQHLLQASLAVVDARK
jgi:hypothetical protein